MPVVTHLTPISRALRPDASEFGAAQPSRTALRRLALDVGLFTVRVSSLESDVRVVRIPRHLVRLERLDPSNN